MRFLSRTFTSLLLFFCTHLAQAAPTSMSYQGRILKSDSTPLEYNNVSFNFSILAPNGTCTIYQEQIDAVDMTNSGGVFDVPLGTGTKSYPASAGFTLLDAFNNSAAITCKGGSTYNPIADDGRVLRVQFHDGTGWKTISPDNVIRSVPYSAYSLSAQKLGANLPTDFVTKIEVNSNTSCGSGNFLTWDATTKTFGCAGVSGASGGTVTGITSANSYLSVANGSANATLTLNVGTSSNTVAAGNDSRLSDSRIPTGTAGGDLSGTYPNPSVAKIQGTDVANSVPTNGQFFKFNGSQWLGSAIAISDVTNLSTSLSGYETTTSFNTAVGSANCAAYETPYWSSVSGKFLCQAINVSIAGDVSGSIGAVTVDKIKGVSVDTTAPTSGQVLKYNGTKWAPAADNNGGGTVTNVTASAPLTVTSGTTTPAISISQASTATNGYLSAADWNTFNGKQASGNYVTALTGDVTATGPNSAAATVAKLQGSTLTITTPANKDYLKYNGSAFVNSPLSASDLSGAIPAANLPAFTGGDVTSSVGSVVLSLAATGTAGTYYKVTTDAKGRVTSGVASLVAADIPNLDWSKITTGKPTTLSGYGITDSLVSNAGGTPSIQTGLDASKPASPSAGAIYFATDSKVIYQYNSGSWISIASASGSGGTITGVTAGTGLSGGGSSGGVTLNLANTAVTAGSYTRANITVDAQGRVTTAASGSSVNLASEVTGTLPIANGGTGATTALGAFNLLSPLTTKGDILTRDATNNIRLAVGTNGQVLSADSTQTGGLKWITPTAGTVTSVTGTLPVVVATGTSTPAISVNAATTTTQGVVQVGSGIAVSSGTISADPANFPSAVPVTKGGTAATSFTANRLIASNGTGSALTTFNCAVGQVLTFDATGLMTCSSFTTGSVFLNGGNAFGANATLGTTDIYSLSFMTGNQTRMTIDTSGNAVLSAGQSSTTTPMMTIQGGAAVTNNIGLRLYDQGTSNGNDNSLEFAHNNGSGPVATARVHSINAGTNSTSGSSLFLETAKDNAGTWNSNQLVLLNTGNVGIGTSTPSSSLHVETHDVTTNKTLLLLKDSDPAGDVTDLSGVSVDFTMTDSNTTAPTNPLGRIAVKVGLNHGTAAGESSGQMIFSTAIGDVAGGTFNTNTLPERMRITENGYVGIGTTTPGIGADFTGRNYLTIKGTGTTASTGSGVLQMTSNSADALNVNLGNIEWLDSANNQTNQRTGYITMATTTATANNRGGDMAFATRPDAGTGALERMRISAAGAVGIGTTAPLGLFDVGQQTGNHLVINSSVADTLSANTGATIYKYWSSTQVSSAIKFSEGNPSTPSGTITMATANGGALVPQMTITNGGLVGIGTITPAYTLQVNGSIAGTSAYVNTSDRRLKRDIANIPKALDKIIQLNGVSYEWRQDEYPEMKLSDRRELGVIAQDVEKVFPEAVGVNKLTGIRSVAYSMLIGPIIEALKEIKNWMSNTDVEVKTLKVQNQQLLQQNSEMKAYLCQKDPSAPFCK